MTSMQNKRGSKVLGAAAVALVLLGGLSACGGGDDDDAAEPTTTSTTVAPTATLEAQLLTLEDLAPEDALEAAWLEGNVQEGVDIELPGAWSRRPPMPR